MRANQKRKTYSVLASASRNSTTSDSLALVSDQIDLYATKYLFEIE